VSFARAIAAALAAEASAYNAIGTRARRLASQFFTPSRTAASALETWPENAATSPFEPKADVRPARPASPSRICT
jgi:hypothetical protein